jgi:hypothetical protein
MGSAPVFTSSIVAVAAISVTTPSPRLLLACLIDASATTGHVDIYAGATNTSGVGPFVDGASLNPNITITYTGLKIKGGSGNDLIENDAKNGIVTGWQRHRSCPGRPTLRLRHSLRS